MSNFQPLDPELTIDPMAISSLTGYDAATGIYLDADQVNSSVLIQTNNTPAMYIDKFQNMGINTVSPSAQLDVNSSSGSGIQLTYNGSTTSKANMSVTSDGKLVLMAGGSEVNVDTSSNFNVKSHNGTNAGLMLANALVLSTADQLNFNVVTPGTAAVSKSLVLNSSGNISGINSLSASALSGTIQTASQPLISSLDVVDITGHTGTAGLSLGGELVTATAEKLNYVDTTPGTAAASKALILDATRNITNINSLTASQLTGTLQTAAQPNVTSLGTLTGLDINGSLTGLTDLSINTVETGRTLVLNDASGNCIRMYYDAATSVANYVDVLVDPTGNLSLTSSGGNVDITSHDGSSKGLRLGSILVTATADQINYLQGTTPGFANPGKALIIDSNLNLANINSLTANLLTGTLQTAAQPNISSVNVLNIAAHNGSTIGLKLNGTLVTATAEELNYVDTTVGMAEAFKAVVLDANKDISGINALVADELSGTLQTAAQPNITSVGTLTSIATSGDLTMGSTVISETEIGVIDAVVPGTASASKAIVLDADKDIIGINSLSASELTGTLQTAAQPNITSVTTLNITGANGTNAGLELGGALVTATAEELNYVDTVAGTAAASKALVLDANKDITNIHALTADELTGTLQTAAQPNITSVGTLTSIATSGDLTMGTTTISEAEIGVLDAVVPGIVSASKALVVDADKNISTINSLSATSVIANQLTGTLQTGAQPNVTSVSTLDITGHNGTDAGLKLGGVLLTATAEQINSIFGAGGEGTFENLAVNDTLTLAGADGTSKGLVLGSTLLTAGADELNYLDGSLPGTVVASKAVVVDANKDITSFRNLTAENLTGTLLTAAQPNITSVGTLTSIATSGNLTMGTTTISEDEIKVLDMVIPGTADASKAVVLDANKDVTGINSLALKKLTLQPSMLTYGETWSGGSTTARYPLATNSGSLRVYSPTLNKALVFSSITGSTPSPSTKYAIMSNVTSYDTTQYDVPGTGTRYVRAAMWHPTLNKFILLLSSQNQTATTATFTIYESTNAINWTLKNNIAGQTFGMNSNIAYHSMSGHLIFFAQGKFMYSADGGSTWNALTGFTGAMDSSKNVSVNSTLIIKSYVLYNIQDDAIGDYLVAWNGTTWAKADLPTNGPTRAYLNNQKDYHESEDRLYIRNGNSGGGVFRVGTIDLISTKLPSTWVAVDNSIPISVNFGIQTTAYVANYGILMIARHDAAGAGVILAILNNISLTRLIIIVGSATSHYGIESMMYPIQWSDGSAVYPGYSSTTGSFASFYSTPSGLSDGIVFGSTVITENELAVVDSVTAGTASASKALVVDANKNISQINTLSATSLAGTITTAAQPNITSVGTLTSITTSGTLTVGTKTISQDEIAVIDDVTPGIAKENKALIVDANRNISNIAELSATSLVGTLATAAQPNIASVDALDITTHDGATVGLKLGGALVTATSMELNYIDGSVPGVVVPSKAVVVDGNKDISSFRNLTAVTLETTAGSLTMGGTNIDETEIAVLDAVVPGTASASKAVVLDASKDISGINDLSAFSLTSTAGSLTMGATDISEAEIGVLDAVVPGTASPSKAVVLDASKDISGIHALSSESLASTAGSLTMGSTIINEAEIAVLDAVVPGVVSASKAVVVDENKDITSFRNLTAVNLTGTLLTAAQPNITSVGELTSLAVAGDISTDSNMIINGSTLTGTIAGWLSNATPGAALANTALVLDGTKSISGISSLTSTDLISTNLTGTLQTAYQPLLTSVDVLDITDHDGSTMGLKLGGVLLTATATQINSIFGEGGEGTFENLTVNDTLTLSGADGTSKGLVIGSTLVTSSGTQLNYVNATPGHAQPMKALVFDENVNIDSINSLSATSLTGTLQTAYQPLLTSVDVLDITDHDGSTMGLKLGGVLLTATATQINSIFGAGAEGTFNNLTINDTLVIANPDGTAKGIYLGETLLTASGIELNYLDGSTPGTATAGNALVLNSASSISGINSLTATSLTATEVTGTLLTAAQPNITSVGTLTSIATSGDLTMGTTVISEAEIGVLDAVVPGTVSPSKAVVVDENKDITSFRNLTAVNLTGTLMTAAQPNITSVGELTSLNVAGDVDVGGNLTVGGTVISEAEIVALDAASPGHASPNKAMITDENNSIDSINALSANTLTGTLQTTAQPNITSVGTLTSLNVAGDVDVGGNLTVGGTMISESEIVALDMATPGHASPNKAMITDENNSIDSINALSANTLTGTLLTTAQPNIATVNALDITTHDGATVGLKLGGTLVTASASELNYVDTTAGSAQASKALVLNADKDISGIRNLSVTSLTTETESITSVIDSTSKTTGALVVAGGVGIAKSLSVGGDSVLEGAITVLGSSTLQSDVSIGGLTESTSAETGALVVAGGVGVGKDLHVGGHAHVVGDVAITGGSTTQGIVTVTNATESTSTTNGSVVVNGGVGIAKNINVGGNALVALDLTVSGDTQLTGDLSLLSATQSTSATTGAVVVAGGVGIGKNLNVAENTSLAGTLSVTGATTQAGTLSVTNVTDSSSVSTGAVVVAGGAGIAKNLNVGGLVNVSDVTDSSSVSTGAVVVAGGAGIAKNLNVGGSVAVDGNMSTAGNMLIDGDMTSSAVILTPSPESSALFEIAAEAEYVVNKTGSGYQWNAGSSASAAGTELMQLDASSLTLNIPENIADLTDSSSASTGALTVAGGVGVAKNFNVGANSSIGGTLAVSGAVSLSSNLNVNDIDDSTSVSTGAVVVAGGVGIAKNLSVGVDVSVGGNASIEGTTSMVGSVSIESVTDSSSTATGSLTTLGGAGIAKNLYVGAEAHVGSSLDVLGATSLTGTLSVDDVTDSTSITTGAAVVAGGVGIAKNLNVGVDASIAGDLSIGGASSFTGAIELNDTTESTSITTGALTVDGGVGIAKNLNVAGIANVSNATPSTSTSTGALVVAGGVGVGSDINVAGDVGVEGDLNLSGDFNVGGVFTTTNLKLIPDAASPFSTLPLTTIAKSDSVLALNKDAGIGYINSSAAVIAIPDLLTTSSVVYYATNGSSSWSVLALKGSALSTYNSSYSGYGIKVNQLYVNSWSGKIWLAGSFFNSGASVAVVLSGTIDDGINTLYTVGSASTSLATIQVTRIAVGTDDNSVVVLKFTGTDTELHRMDIATSPSFTLVATDAFVSVAWLNGLGKFVATRNATSSIYCSTNGSASSWSDATTPTAVGANTVVFNTTINLAVAVGPNYLWYSTNGLTWTEGSYVALSSGDLFNAVVNSPVSGLIVVYSNVNNSTDQVYYTVDAINWLSVSLTGETFGYEVSHSSIVAFSQQNYAFALGVNGGVDSVQSIGPITSASMIYEFTVESGYVKNESAIGYEWYNNSTDTSPGDKIMTLNSNGLAVEPIVNVKNTTNSTSTSTGSFITSGGAGIAKNLNVGMNLTVGGTLEINGSIQQDGKLEITNDTESTSTSTGSIITAGGVGVAKSLNVGIDTAIGGSLNVGGASSLIGAVSIANAVESMSASTGSLKTDGGVGIAKSLNVGLNAQVAGDVTIGGSTTQNGLLLVSNVTDSTSASTGSITTAGGVGIAKSLKVGTSASIGGAFSVSGTSSFLNVVSVSDVTESSSTSTGSIVAAGGVGVAKSLFVGNDASVGDSLTVSGTSALVGDVLMSSTTNSTSSSTGALVVAGGVGIAQALYVGSNASVQGSLSVAGTALVSDETNAMSVTTGALTIAGGVGIVKSLHVGDGIYGVIQTAAQPNISSVTTLNITGANGTNAGLSLAGSLVLASATELNYIHGSTPGAASASNALVVDVNKDITGINALSAAQLTGTIQTASQPLITSVSTLNIAGHDGMEAGLSLGGTLVTVTASQLNSLFAGTSSQTFVNATVTNNLTLSGADGSSAGLILGSTLVTSSGAQLNYVNTTPGSAQPMKALVLNSDSDISGINSLSATSLTGTIQTASQPNINSVYTLDVTGHNGSSLGLALGGVLVTATANEINFVDTTPGTAEASKALVVNETKNISGINSLSATFLTGTLLTAAQPNITSVGELTSLAVAGTITIGSTELSETDLAKIDAITNGSASANKALVLNASKDISGIHTLGAEFLSVGSPLNSDLPLEVGHKPYIFTGAYAYNNDQNAHGMVDAGMGTMSNYSARLDGKLLVTGEVQITSDRRLKTNVTDISLDMAKRFVMESQPIRFNWKNGDSTPELGWLAQSVYKLGGGLEELVTVTPHPGMQEEIDEDGFINPADAKFTLATGKVIPLLTMTTKDLYEQNKLKDEKIADLEARLAKLEEMFSKMMQ